MEDYENALADKPIKSLNKELEPSEINCLDESTLLRNGIQRLNKITHVNSAAYENTTNRGISTDRDHIEEIERERDKIAHENE